MAKAPTPTHVQPEFYSGKLLYPIIAALIALSALFGLVVMPRLAPAGGNLMDNPAPEFALPVLANGDDGARVKLSDLRGKVVILDFWATWCGPCVAEIPNMLAEYEKYHDKGFEVVGISLDEERADVEKFVVENKIPWPIIFAGKGWQDPVAQFYGISGIPQLVLIGRDGNVITLDIRGEKLGERLAELFKDAG